MPLLKMCRLLGIEAAFENLIAPGAPPFRPVQFEIPLTQLEALGQALRPLDEAQIERLRQTYPRLNSFMNLEQSVLFLANSRDYAEIASVIESRPELLHPTADKALRGLVDQQKTLAAKVKVESFRPLLRRCREAGVALAMHELKRFWEFNET